MRPIEEAELVLADGELRAIWSGRSTLLGHPAVHLGPLEVLDAAAARFYRVWARGLLAEAVLAS